MFAEGTRHARCETHWSVAGMFGTFVVQSDGSRFKPLLVHRLARRTCSTSSRSTRGPGKQRLGKGVRSPSPRARCATPTGLTSSIGDSKRGDRGPKASFAPSFARQGILHVD